MSLIGSRLLCPLVAGIFAHSAHAATINGQALNFQYVFGDDLDSISTLPESGIYQVGTEFQTIFFDIRIGVSNNQVRLEWLEDTNVNNSMPYNGIKLTDAFGLVPDFLVFQRAASPGVSNITTFFDTETLFINLTDTGPVSAGSTALFEFRLSDTVPTVPLPASLSFLALGLGSIGVLRHRKSRATG
jgi:hypothetical protein